MVAIGFHRSQDLKMKCLIHISTTVILQQSHSVLRIQNGSQFVVKMSQFVTKLVPMFLFANKEHNQIETLIILQGFFIRARLRGFTECWVSSLYC